MTSEERMIITCYTGVSMVPFSQFHERVELLMERPVFTHEMGEKGFWERLKELVKEDFLALCVSEDKEEVKK